MPSRAISMIAAGPPRHTRHAHSAKISDRSATARPAKRLKELTSTLHRLEKCSDTDCH
ncbi:MAG: hypothetical protein JWP48_123 [Actinoallomurus sp.]|nr:hypothetical protein [Actinoallomurus sp.]